MLDIWEPFRNWLLVFKTQVSSCTVGVEVLRMRRVVTWVHAVLEVTCTDDVPGKSDDWPFPAITCGTDWSFGVSTRIFGIGG